MLSRNSPAHSCTTRRTVFRGNCFTAPATPESITPSQLPRKNRKKLFNGETLHVFIITRLCSSFCIAWDKSELNSLESKAWVKTRKWRHIPSGIYTLVMYILFVLRTSYLIILGLIVDNRRGFTRELQVKRYEAMLIHVKNTRAEKDET